MKSKPTSLSKTLGHIMAQEKCQIDDALMAFGLNAVMAGMSLVPACQEQVVLKGGTSLRLLLKQPLGRISTDLDLSLVAGARVTTEVFTGDVRRQCANVLAEYFTDTAEIDIQLRLDRQQPKYADTMKLMVWRLTARYKKTLANRSGFLVELALDEFVDLDKTFMLETTAHQMPIRLRAYAPIQSIAEKLRAILQKHQHFDRNGLINNFEARHVTDLVALKSLLQPGDLETLHVLFHRKCDARRIPQAERTRERLLNPKLKEAVATSHQKLQLRTDPWLVLVSLVDIVLN